MPSMWLSDTQKIGAIFCIAGTNYLFITSPCASPSLQHPSSLSITSHPSSICPPLTCPLTTPSTGILFLTLGTVLLFDRPLLSMGNLLFLLGLLIIIGPSKTVLFFARPQKLKGTAAFTVGIVLILLRWTFVGFVVELYGVWVLFGDFLGTVAGFAGSVPVVGPYIAKFLTMAGGSKRGKELPV